MEVIDRVTRVLNSAEARIGLAMAMLTMTAGCLPKPAPQMPTPPEDEQKHPTATWVTPIETAVNQPQATVAPTKEPVLKPEVTATTIKQTPTVAEPTHEVGPDPKMLEKWKASVNQWQTSGAEGVLPQEWVDFKDGKGKLDTKQMEALGKFSNQMETWNYLIRVSQTSKGTQIKMMPETKDLFVATAEGQLYIPIYGNINSVRDLGEAKGLMVAAIMPGLTQRWSSDTNMVEYTDASGKVEMTATAIIPTSPMKPKLTLEDFSQAELKRLQVSTFPVHDWMSWAGIDRLTIGQRDELQKSMALLDKYPELSFFKGTKNVGFIGNDKTGYSGIGFITVGRLMFNYNGAVDETLIHEIGHQFRQDECGFPAEIGNGQIPDGFDKLTAEEVRTRFLQGEFGSYHLTLWLVRKENLPTNTNWEYMIKHRETVPPCE